MKKTIIFALLFCGCMPQQKLTGRLIDTSGPVADAAVLGMIWVEDAAKALPAPEINSITPEDRDVALDKDMAARGLPAAYSRTFSDKGGHFTIAKLHFSSETEQAIKAMKQPRITRVTLWAFQRNYRKQAVTLFPKQGEDVSPATLLLLKPADWKELYRDNTVDTLTQDYMVKGYSKEFGATKQEKRWLLEYTHSNLWKAYVDSDIKGDKEMTELCGRDYSGVTVSTAGIAWDQTHERCAELKKRMGAVREIEESWISHANKSGDTFAAAKEVVHQAIALLPAEAAEPKEYESLILAGLEDAANAKNKEAVLSANPGLSMEEEAKLQYGKGDKASAYRAMGKTIFTQIPEEIKRGELAAQLAARTILGIRETAAGFYLLMNRPLTAQLPGGDGGNGHDMPKAEVKKATGSVECLGCYVRHEDKEVVVFDDDGKEIERVYSSAFHRNPRIPTGLKEKVLKKLGIKDLRDNTGLAPKYNAEMRKLIKSTPLPNERLRFYDEKHNVRKEIILEKKVLSSTRVYNAAWNEYRQYYTLLNRQARADGNGSGAVVVESVGEVRETSTDNFTLEYYDASGNLMWSKKFPQNKVISEFAISEDGRKVAIIGICNECDQLPANTKLGFEVYSLNGVEILRFPDYGKGEEYSPSSHIIMSPSGNYMAVTCKNREHDNIPVFINTEEKSFYVYDNYQASVPIISDEGIAHINFWGPEGKVLDLKTVKFEALQ